MPMRSSMRKTVSATRIGLLTPYTGGNLGDGAIQEAVIQNIRMRYPDAAIFGITQDPDRTGVLHRIPCYPISSFSTSHYGVMKEKRNSELLPSSGIKARLIAKIKGTVRQVPFVSGLLRSAYRIFCQTSAEVVHTLEGFRLLKRADLLLVSGGGQLDDYWGGPWGHPFALFKWALISRATRTRFAFLSVGLCSSDSMLTRLFLEKALKWASYRSYRDWKSKGLLEGIEFTRNDPVFPDLAFSYAPGQEQEDPVNKTNGKVVGVSPIAYLSQHSWPRQDQRVYRNYITKLAGFISGLLEKGFEILVFHTDDPDRLVIEELLGIMDKEHGVKPERFRRPQIHDVEDLALHLSSIDFAVVSRLHGILLSYLVQKPVLAISYDRKVDTYMADMDQTEYCVDIHDFDVRALTQTFGSLAQHRGEIMRKTAERVAGNKKALMEQYDRVLRH